MSEKDILEQLRAAITKDMRSVLGDGGHQLVIYQVAQTYLQLKILDKLEDINTKLDMINCNIIDVENAIDKLNPVYK